MSDSLCMLVLGLAKHEETKASRCIVPETVSILDDKIASLFPLYLFEALFCYRSTVLLPVESCLHRTRSKEYLGSDEDGSTRRTRENREDPITPNSTQTIIIPHEGETDGAGTIPRRGRPEAYPTPPKATATPAASRGRQRAAQGLSPATAGTAGGPPRTPSL